MSDHIRVRIDTTALMRLGQDPSGPIFRHMVTLGARVETAAKRNASGSIVKVRTGTLRSGIDASQPELRGSHLVVPVTATAAYALAVHEGSRPHEITAGPGRVLAWQAGGRTVTATKVMHPGSKARPFLRDALPAIQ